VVAELVHIGAVRLAVAQASSEELLWDNHPVHTTFGYISKPAMHVTSPSDLGVPGQWVWPRLTYASYLGLVGDRRLGGEDDVCGVQNGVLL
jgi:hypothetical protein